MNVKSISKPVICALLALAVVAVACGGPAVLPAPSETPASTPSAQPTATPVPVEPQVPESPAALPVPAGSPEEQAIALADSLAPDSPDRLAGWLSAYDALGVPVIGSDGSALGSTGDDPIGPAYWRIWYMSGMGASAPGFSLVDLASGFNATGSSAYDAQQAAALLLDDLRAAAASEDPQVQLFGRFAAEMVKRGPSAVDMLDPAVTADQVSIRGDLAELLAWVAIRNLVFSEAAAPIAALHVPHLARPAAFGPRLQGNENCSEAAGDEDVTYWLNWALNKIGGGFQLPGMTGATSGFIQMVQEHLGVKVGVIEKAQKIGSMVNLVTSILTLAMQLAALTVDSVMEPEPLERTKGTADGNEATIHFRLTMDPDALPDGNNLYACLASFLLNAFGVSFSFPAEGRIAGAEMTFEGGQGFGEYVLFGDYRQLRIDTNANGEVPLKVIGKGQKRKLPDDAEPFMREFSIVVEAQPEAVTGNTIANIFFGGLTFGAAPGVAGGIGSAIDISKGFHWDLGEYFYNIQDWQTGYVVDGTYFLSYQMTGTICDGIGKPFTLHAVNSAAAAGDYTFTPAGETGGSWAFAGAMSMSGWPVEATGTYEVIGADAGGPALRFGGDGRWVAHTPVGTLPMGPGGRHLDGDETIPLQPAQAECLSQ